MDHPAPNTEHSTDRLSTLTGGGMDRAVKPSRHKTLIRRGLRYGTPVAIVVVLSAGWQLVPASGTLSVKREQVSVATVISAPFLDYLPVRATVAPLNVTFIDAVQGGEVAEVVTKDGSLVKKGDVLARLTNPQLQLDVTSREAQIASQLGGVSAQRLALQQTRSTEQAQLAESRYNLLKAQRELSIREQLRGQGFESDANVQSYHDEADYYAQRLKHLEEAIERDIEVADLQAKEIDQEAQRLRSNLDVVEASLNSLVLRAPVSGRLTNFDLQPGQSLKAGDKIGQIDSEGQYRLDADVDEFYLGRIAVGEHASADREGVKVLLTVSRVHPQVTNGQFRAELIFDKTPSGELRRGESIDVKITLGETHQALVLPNGAWLEASGGSSAFMVASNLHSANRVTITSGRRNPEQVEITGGLHDGDRVIVSSYNTYKKFNHLIIQ